MTTEATVPLVQPGAENLGQSEAEKAAALAAAQAAAAAIKPPDTTRATALAEIEKLKRDPEFRQKLLNGGTAEVTRWRDLNKAAAAPATTDEESAELAGRIMTLQKFGLPDLNSEVGKDLLAVMSGKPISVETRRAAEAKRSALMADKGFVQKYMDGDQEARRVFMTVNVLMAAQVERKVA
jgi:hypothetical protein